MQDIAGVGITIATILAATFFSHQSINSLRTELRAEINGLRTELSSEASSLRKEIHSEVNGLRSEVLTKLESIQKDMREFYAEQARHDVRLTNLEQQHKN